MPETTHNRRAWLLKNNVKVRRIEFLWDQGTLDSSYSCWSNWGVSRKAYQGYNRAVVRRIMEAPTTRGFRLVLPLTLLLLAAPALLLPVHATTCTLVNTSRGTLTTAASDQAIGMIDATGCDIGDFITGSLAITGLTAHDANQYGVFVNGSAIATTTVTIDTSAVYNIGAHSGAAFTPNGVQTGIGIIYDSGSSGQSITGTISNTLVHDYQKGGIVINHNANVNLNGNTVTGLGPVGFIAQNGVQISRGATATLTANTITGNQYTQNPSCAPSCVGSAVGVVATGVLFFQANLGGASPGQVTGQTASSNTINR